MKIYPKFGVCHNANRRLKATVLTGPGKTKLVDQLLITCILLQSYSGSRFNSQLWCDWLSVFGQKGTWVMEGDQDKVFDGSGPPVEGLLQDPRGAVYHLFQIVVH